MWGAERHASHRDVDFTEPADCGFERLVWQLKVAQLTKQRCRSIAADEDLRPIAGSVDQRGIFANNVSINRANQMLGTIRNRFQDKRIMAAEHMEMRNRLALDIREKRFTTLSRLQSIDVVRTKPVQNLRAIGACHLDLRPRAEITIHDTVAEYVELLRKRTHSPVAARAACCALPSKMQESCCWLSRST